jgi:dethiobiotin synthetase
MIIAITGTGTGVGKTHVACALVAGLRARGLRAVGWKPVESGVADDQPDSDEARLRIASGIAAAPTTRFREPLSPHLAARRVGISIDGAAIRATLDELAAKWEVVVLELAGGLFSPLNDEQTNADWLATASGYRLVVVAADRLGTLHECVATIRAAAHTGVAIRAIVTSPPANPDASTGSNAAELRRLVPGLPIIELPRASVDELASRAELIDLADG